MKNKIALFGGSFDPPHLGHLKVAQAVLGQKLFDEIWFLPVFEHQVKFDKPQMSSWEDRIAMLTQIKNQESKIKNKVKISEFEKSSGKKSYTHLALRELSKKYPQYKFSWLMGSDQLATLKDWKCDLHQACFPTCASEFDYYVYPRGGFKMNLPYDNLKIITGVEPVNISSTQIRELVRAGKSIKGLVSKEVEEYIKKRELYK